tara:strand:- start:689 stop:967 length:279 start_codon:yes stop_codon:yes gene_type:complete
MTPDRKVLLKRARVRFWVPYLMLPLGFLVAIGLGALGGLLLLPLFIAVNIVSSTSVSHVRCDNCGKPYGVGLSAFASVEVPERCVCCGAKAR